MKTVATNRRARFDYEIADTVEAGIVLTGQEVKSCRQGNVTIAGAYVSMLSGKPVLKNATISKYSHASSVGDYDPHRDRILLLTSHDIEKLTTKLAERGMSLVPLEMTAGRHVKVVLGLGKGRKRIDKRQRIKERDVERKLKSGREY